jgi:hypothetical protein
MGMAEGSNVMSDLTNEKTEDEMMLEPEISDESLEAAAGGRSAYTYLFFCTQTTCPQGIEVL